MSHSHEGQLYRLTQDTEVSFFVALGYYLAHQLAQFGIERILRGVGQHRAGAAIVALFGAKLAIHAHHRPILPKVFGTAFDRF